MSCVVITGAAGFVGLHLSSYLAQEGLEVHGLDRRRKPDGWIWPWHTADLLDLDSLQAVLRSLEPDYVFHLAALIRNALLDELLMVNVVGTENLLMAVLESQPQARVLVTGSAAEYGLVQAEDSPISEACSLRPLSPYGLSKAAQSLLAAQYWHRNGMAILRTRAFNIVGPGEPATQVASAIARQIAEIEAGHVSPEIQVGNLDTIRDFTDVRDVVRAYWSVICLGQPGEVYNVCSGCGTRIRDLLDYMLALTQQSVQVRQMTHRLTPWDVPVQIGSPDRLKRLAKFEPTFSLQESLSALLDGWRKQMAAPLL